jgi:hypothetical protein
MTIILRSGPGLATAAIRQGEHLGFNGRDFRGDARPHLHRQLGALKLPDKLGPNFKTYWGGLGPLAVNPKPFFKNCIAIVDTTGKPRAAVSAAEDEPTM